MKFILFLTVLFTSMFASAQKSEEKQILKVLQLQTEAWNRGDIEAYMKTYWKHDSLMFIGKNGIQWGWEKTLANYKKSYPDKAAMGKLSFNIMQTKKLSADYYYVVGKWMLTRSIGDLSGHFDLLIRKIRGRWVIVADHSS